MEPVRWGLLSTARINDAILTGAAQTETTEIVAVASRDQGRADAYAREHGLSRAHGSYEALLADDDVEVVYNSLPNSMHVEWSVRALEAGKHVLCEKPLTLDVAEAVEMVRLADEHDRFLMEAMWTACHPVVRALRERLRAGEFGTPRHLHAELGFRVDAGPESRMFEPVLGASALLDMGVYPLTFAHLMLGPAEELHATADLSERGIDLDIAVSGRYPGGVMATMTASMTSWSSRSAGIATDRGRIDLGDFHHPERAVFTPYVQGPANDIVERGDPVEILGEEPVLGRGYGNEIAEVGRCLRDDLRESPLVPHAQTLTILREMDELRAQVGVTFP
jgi:predicted dehydrogenase